MSTPVRADREDAGDLSPVVASPPSNATSLKVTQELQLISAELTEALLAEQATFKEKCDAFRKVSLAPDTILCL